ncbi:hypothetical protein SAMN04488057_101336 [Cyclobacterium lianum]|uniref:Outer membrane protein beta-barrel domain-containing protein n=1 Tax=Cyclobacterium lianum TaxID=388280 RepID=A0A1M7IIM9_9BACT|nr:hypothetical protein [Cyclobacterium lianum]SHM40287.1 hypothetical protein SAMN04488057_101336 [Cyclobacterium lianum]
MRKIVTRAFLLSAMLLLLLGGISRSHAQQAAGSFLISSGLDLVRTDIQGIFQKAQLGAEVNYFHLHQLSFSGGFEYNTAGANQITGGLRFYPLEAAFIRARALVGNNADLGLGAGYTYNITYRMRLEGIADYYVQNQTLGARITLAVLIK